MSTPEAGELRLDYVSPLPPVRSGIADYSLDLLPHLAPLCDLRVVALPDLPLSEATVSCWSPVPAGETGADGRLPLYQMGNNHYHEGVRRLALEHPGVLTLHDLVLHHALLDRTLGKGDFPPYREALTRDHGWVGEKAALPRRWGGYGNAAHFFLPAQRSLLRRQRGILVHSAWAAACLREEDPQLRVRAVPMGIPLPEPPEPALGMAFRRRLGVPDGAPLLGSFGFQTPIKRPEVAIRALASEPLAGVHLVIAGQVAEILDLDDEARRAGVAARVHVTGFLGFQEFHAAISGCDLCLNLRYPTAGETSASLLRVLALGRAAVVSDYAQFAELPDDVVLKIPLGEGEVEALAACVSAALGARGEVEARGRAAREYVRRRHDPVAAARAVISACREWQQAEPPGEAPPAEREPTSLTWSRMTSRLEVAGAERPWPPGERRTLTVRLANEGECRWLAGTSGAGGVVLEVQLWADGVDLFAGRPWPPLPRDLGPGEAVTWELELRRPLGPSRLRLEPHVLGLAGFGMLGGAVWEAMI